MIFVPGAAQDIERYYDNTYVKFQETGDRLFFIDFVSRSKVSGLCDDDSPFDLWLSDEFPYEVSYVLPNKSYFQMGLHAYLMERKPAKQYKRGLCSDNVMISRNRNGSGEFLHVSIDFEVLKAFVAKATFPTLKEAFLNEGKLMSVAISPRIMYVPKGGKLYIDKTHVATLKGTKAGNRLIEMVQPIFKDDIEALLDKNQPYFSFI